MLSNGARKQRKYYLKLQLWLVLGCLVLSWLGLGYVVLCCVVYNPPAAMRLQPPPLLRVRLDPQKSKQRLLAVNRQTLTAKWSKVARFRQAEIIT